MWRLDRREGAAIFAVAGCTLILPIAQNPETGAFPNRGGSVFGTTLVQHHRAFYSRKQPELRLIFTATTVKKNHVVIETTGFFVVRPSGFPLSGINLESAAHSKNLPNGRFFVVRPSGFPLSGINLESSAHSKKTCLTAGFLWYARADFPSRG